MITLIYRRLNYRLHPYSTSQWLHFSPVAEPQPHQPQLRLLATDRAPETLIQNNHKMSTSPDADRFSVQSYRPSQRSQPFLLPETVASAVLRTRAVNTPAVSSVESNESTTPESPRSRHRRWLQYAAIAYTQGLLRRAYAPVERDFPRFTRDLNREAELGRLFTFSGDSDQPEPPRSQLDGSSYFPTHSSSRSTTPDSANSESTLSDASSTDLWGFQPRQLESQPRQPQPALPEPSQRRGPRLRPRIALHHRTRSGAIWTNDWNTLRLPQLVRPTRIHRISRRVPSYSSRSRLPSLFSFQNSASYASSARLGGFANRNNRSRHHRFDSIVSYSSYTPTNIIDRITRPTLWPTPRMQPPERGSTGSP